MEREKARFNILDRIEAEKKARGWTEYQLAVNSGLTQSTISTWFKKDLQPSIASIEKVCSGLGISLSEFFSETDETYLTREQAELVSVWNSFTPDERCAVLQMLKAFQKDREKK